MKIGIITLYHENFNYGGQLQAYALQSYLQSKGLDCEQISFRHETILEENKSMISKISRRLFTKPFLHGRVRQVYRNRINAQRYSEFMLEEYGKDIRKERFEYFMESIPHSENVDSKDVSSGIERYDVLITGGDQVWNTSWFNSAYFLGFANSNQKKISYSASAGKDNFSLEDAQIFRRYLKSFDTVLVREKNLENYLSEKCGIESELTIDPVGLFDKEDWEKFSSKVELPEHYIFAYVLGKDKTSRQEIMRIGKNMGLPVVCIPHPWFTYNKNDENFGDVWIGDAGPREFVYMLLNADYVATDSFHGTLFSIIFEKPFIAFSRFRSNEKISLNSRILSILGILSIEDRYVSDLTECAEIQEMDYSDCKIKMKAFCDKSKRMLDNCIIPMTGCLNGE